jgi:tight adherence protein B
MLTLVVLGLALGFGAPVVAVALLALALFHPVWFLVGVAGWSLRDRLLRRAASEGEEAAFLRGLAAELAAGASLRTAIAAASERAPGLQLHRAVRLCRAGRPAPEIGTALREALPAHGPAAAAAFRLAAQTGGGVGRVVEALADRAEAEDRLARERAASTAQARLSAWLVGGIPVGLVVVGWATGRGPDFGALGSAGPVVLAAGLGLIAAGAAVVWSMMRRAAR